MGNIQTIQKVSFEDIQKLPSNMILINTLPEDCQDCLIKGTLPASMEEKKINSLLKSGKDQSIIIYGKNTNDEKVILKYKQFVAMGFQNIFVYLGGLFEWLLLQDIYGTEEFPTTQMERDLLKFKPSNYL
jgi:hypothetical protein